eukprot:6177116-Pleurochrysis_carterae.AAC.1
MSISPILLRRGLRILHFLHINSTAHLSRVARTHRYRKGRWDRRLAIRNLAAHLYTVSNRNYELRSTGLPGCLSKLRALAERGG